MKNNITFAYSDLNNFEILGLKFDQLLFCPETLEFSETIPTNLRNEIIEQYETEYQLYLTEKITLDIDYSDNLIFDH